MALESPRGRGRPRSAPALLTLALAALAAGCLSGCGNEKFDRGRDSGMGGGGGGGSIGGGGTGSGGADAGAGGTGGGDAGRGGAGGTDAGAGGAGGASTGGAGGTDAGTGGAGGASTGGAGGADAGSGGAGGASTGGTGGGDAGVDAPQDTGGADAPDDGGPVDTGPDVPVVLSVTGVSPPTGRAAPGGFSVTVTGTGFTAGATVTIGGTPLDGVVVGAGGTTITGTTRTHAPGVADVVVTNPDTMTVTLTGGYTYVTFNPEVILDDMEHLGITIPSTYPIVEYRGRTWGASGPANTNWSCAINGTETRPNGGQFMTCQGYVCSFGPQLRLQPGTPHNASPYDTIKFWTRAHNVAAAPFISPRSWQLLDVAGNWLTNPGPTFPVDTWAETTIYLNDLLQDRFGRPTNARAATIASSRGFQLQGGAPRTAQFTEVACVAATPADPPNYAFDIDHVRFVTRSTIDDFQDNDVVPTKQVFTLDAEGPGTWAASANATFIVASQDVISNGESVGFRFWGRLSTPAPIADQQVAAATVLLRPLDGASARQPYDASGFVGFTYKARSTAAAEVTAKILDPANPQGGYATTCTGITNPIFTDPPAVACAVTFSSLAGFDPSKMYGIVFEVRNAAGAAAATDVDIDDLRFTWP